MKSADFVQRFYELMSQFLDETHLSTQLLLSLSQPLSQHPTSSDIFAASLEKHISSLQTLLGTVKASINAASDTKQVTTSPVNPELVQIVASSNEIERRIQAFMNRKQSEVDDANCREFCRVATSNTVEDSCARTDSVFTPRDGSKSHVKVSRVAHAYGPQTRPHLINAENVKVDITTQRSPWKRERHEGVEERLQNMESFLKLRKGQKVPENVYQRMKVLEERILQLESLSPEYFSISPSAFKRQRLSQSTSDDTDLEEINNRIKQLEESLRKKKVPSTNDNKSPP
ncbi:putative MAP3K12-binding inhibitory protein 1-like [Apostichopus japonicus]|uniref:Putative MAP3K12-binding inhibitory protein 1-like n=1 Tax=Stichopus japonicus TaxID=307972 RepID=A0A2G8JK75_STIJA|nr:putative MAP3K12-binding inhibitory protein 1-like [Apostichopus japonicus]